MLDYHRTAEQRLGELEHRRGTDGTLEVERAERLRIHENTAAAPDPAIIDRWRTDLSADEIAEVEAEAGALLGELGYR
jgi:hypothetical protein